jgi:DNA modification methylase
MTITILTGCCLSVLMTLPEKSVNACVTSPPYYGLRDYGVAGQLGLEPTPEAYVANMVKVFREVRRVLRDDGTLWLNIGDSYANGGAGCKPKDLMGTPWMLAFALRADGWYLRSDIIWHKPNCMPESASDRPTKSHEYIFLLSKNAIYYYDNEAIKEDAAYPNDKRRPLGSKGAWQMDGRTQGENGGGKPYDHDTSKRNKRTVWTVTAKSCKEAHFATYPPELIKPCILASCPLGGIVLDPFFGAGTTGLVAKRLGRSCIGIELNQEYAAIAHKRLSKELGMFADTMLAAG